MRYSFASAQESASTLTNDKKLTDEESLKLYKYYKQATEGDCNTPKPTFLEFKAYERWEHWKRLTGMGKEEAELKYVEECVALLAKYGYPELTAEKEEKPQESDVTANPAVSVNLEAQGNFVLQKHRYLNEVETLVPDFKAVCAETEADGWVFVKESNGVKISQKPSDASPMGVLKGEGMVPGFSPECVLAVLQTPGSRHIWDEFYQSSSVLEVLDHNTHSNLFTLATKKVMLSSSRDTVNVQRIAFEEDGTIWLALRSVVDPKYPEVDGRVRAFATIAGFCLKPIKERGKISTHVTYISNSDPKGSIPGSLLKMASSNVPMTIYAVVKYIQSSGIPAFPLALTGPVTNSQFDQDTGTLVITYKNSLGSFHPATKILIHKSKYPNGVDIKSQNQLEMYWEKTTFILYVKSSLEEDVTLKITARATRNSGGSVMFNDAVVPPVPGAPATEAAVTAPTRTPLTVAQQITELRQEVESLRVHINRFEQAKMKNASKISSYAIMAFGVALLSFFAPNFL
eukprot:Lithocolla_globosa_v1_NODE_3442_length_1667_cov_8.800868.p1 type:complete len:515 gc:universal NODE_3442_length_1667_cov_8.800868:1588-44(-)